MKVTLPKQVSVAKLIWVYAQLCHLERVHSPSSIELTVGGCKVKSPHKASNFPKLVNSCGFRLHHLYKMECCSSQD